MRSNRKLVLEAQELLKQLQANTNNDIEQLKNSKAMVLVHKAIEEVRKYLNKESTIIPMKGLERFVERVTEDIMSLEHGQDAVGVFNTYYSLLVDLYDCNE